MKKYISVSNLTLSLWLDFVRPALRAVNMLEEAKQMLYQIEVSIKYRTATREALAILHEALAAKIAETLTETTEEPKEETPMFPNLTAAVNAHFDENAAPVPDFKKSREYHQMRMIVYKQGGFREKEILSNPHIIERDETWNDQHKVLNVLEVEPQIDGYRNGFAVDLVTMSICG